MKKTLIKKEKTIAWYNRAGYRGGCMYNPFIEKHDVNQPDQDLIDKALAGRRRGA